MRKFTDYLIYTNIYMAAAAVAFLSVGYGLIGKPAALGPLCFAFFATLAIYNIGSLDYRQDPESGPIPQRVARLALYAGLLGVAVSFFFLTDRQILFVSHLAVLSGLYSIPFAGLHKLSLRRVPYLKPFLVSYVWTATALGLPVVGLGVDYFDWAWVFMFVKMYFFALAVAIPFDIRDHDFDLSDKVKTIANGFGDSKAKLTAFTALVISCLSGLLYFEGVFMAYELLLFVFSASVLTFANKGNHALYFKGLLDGLLFINAALFALAGQLELLFN